MAASRWFVSRGSHPDLLQRHFWIALPFLNSTREEEVTIPVLESLFVADPRSALHQGCATPKAIGQSKSPKWPAGS
jgi:hypothetical protein